MIGEDIILRREVPTTGLDSLGIENVSFTYDELRDFLLSYYTVMELAVSHPTHVKGIFERIPEWPIYEGFFRYGYVLARKQSSDAVLAACEASGDFRKHYLNNLSLLSPDIQTPEDVGRVETILKDGAAEHDIQQIAWFLFHKREDSDHLNIRILLDHVNRLNAEESALFFRAMFSSSSGYRDSNWTDEVSNLLHYINELSKDQKIGLGVQVLALVLHFAPYARWDEREATLNFFTKFHFTQEVGGAIEACKKAASGKVQSCLKEISEKRAEL